MYCMLAIVDIAIGKYNWPPSMLTDIRVTLLAGLHSQETNMIKSAFLKTIEMVFEAFCDSQQLLRMNTKMLRVPRM